MADARLSVEVGAKLDQLNTGFANAIKIVESGATQLDNSTKKVERSFKLLNDTKFTFGANFQTASQKLADQAAKTGAALGGSFSAGSNRAAFALQNLGRVAQDAPFGFIGIQNNLNPLLESFAMLRKETGSNGAALKALGSSLIGPAGLGIALSLVSAGVLLYQQYQQRANKVVKEAKEDADAYIKTLDQTRQAALKGAQDSQRELATVTALFSAYSNANLPLEKRRDAYKQLQDQYPAYFSNIKFESDASKITTESYNKLTESIIATGRARAAIGLIAQNESRRLQNEQKSIDANVEYRNILRQLDANKEIVENQKNSSAAQNAQALARLNAGVETEKLSDLTNQINNLDTDNNRIKEKNLQLIKSINKEVENGAKITGGVGDLDKPEKGTKNEPGLASTERAEGITKLAEVFKKESAVISMSTDSITASNDKFNQSFINAGLVAQVQEYYRALDEQNKILSDSFTDAFGSIGLSIGEALANGGSIFDAFGQEVLKSIGGILIQFGKLTLAAGIASTALGKALKNPLDPGSGAAAIAAGVALIAIGGLVSSFSGKVGDGGGSSNSAAQRRRIPGFANGTDFAPGGLAWVGERGPEIMQVPKGASITPNHDLKGLGGATNINLAGKLRVGMRELIFEIDKERSLQRRSG